MLAAITPSPMRWLSTPLVHNHSDVDYCGLPWSTPNGIRLVARPVEDS
jgi:hypothetical protein